jgi:hypothetical protein
MTLPDNLTYIHNSIETDKQGDSVLVEAKSFKNCGSTM